MFYKIDRRLVAIRKEGRLLPTLRLIRDHTKYQGPELMPTKCHSSHAQSGTVTTSHATDTVKADTRRF